MKIFRTAIAAAALALTVSLSSVAAADEAFLAVEGIQGDSIDRGFERAIVVRSFSFGVTNSSSGSGSVAGRASFASLSISKSLDRASTGLMKAAATGQVIPSVVLSLRKNGGTQPVFYRVTLSNVVVSSYKLSDALGSAAAQTEELQLGYGKVTVEFFSQGLDGRVTSTGKFSFDVAAGKPQ